MHGSIGCSELPFYMQCMTVIAMWSKLEEKQEINKEKTEQVSFGGRGGDNQYNQPLSMGPGDSHISPLFT